MGGAESLSQKVAQFAGSRKGQIVGTGECFDLADQALRSAGAKSAADYGTITKQGDYTWGKAIVANTAGAGDILQFRQFKVTTNTTRSYTLRFPDGQSITYEKFETRIKARPHHTAIVVESDRTTGAHTVLEQNVDGRKSVGQEDLSLTSSKVSGKAQETVVINAQWGQQVKKGFTKSDDRKWVDQLVKKHAGKQIKADVATKSIVKVEGAVRAFRPETAGSR